ncbi:MAG: valine--tRNA ligase [Candidatus Falkowbacteria bacterium]
MPKKELPKIYNPADYEDAIYAKWEKSGFFNPDECIKNGITEADKPAFTISMPPPNRTGILHIGHASMLVIQDILTRYHRMKGERALWLPGTDHAAIATQTKVEKILKEEGSDRYKLGREKFLERVIKFAQESHDTIIDQIKKMGSSCDWSREAYTFDETRNKAVNSVFKLMYNDGLIYRGYRIVNWCPRCQSTLSDDEVEYKEEAGKLYWLKYGPFILATSRPETKLGDTAVAVYPGDKRYKDMVGKKYMIPGVLGEFEITVVADRVVDPEFGSGAIKVTPAHDFTDYEIAQRHGIAMKQIINEQGKMMANTGKYAGLTTAEARIAIVVDMKKIGLIDHVENNYTHNIAICYRCSTQIEPLPSLQWFIDVNKKIPKYKKTIKKLSVEAVKKGVFGREKIKIVPERFEKNYFHWMNNLHDWCISRQIWFGHRVPVWYKGKKIYVGVEAPVGDGWKQDEDTLDTWFSSGLWTFSTLAHSPDEIKIKNGKLEIKSDDFKNYHPTSVLETGYDILFFWVARMIIMATYALGDIPFKDVYLHGLIRDDKGRKMSKSLGNAIDPLDSCKKFGTDATRLSLIIGTTPGNDMNLSEEKIASYRNFANKLWNISRYVIEKSKVKSQKSKLQVKTQNLTLADSWILSKIDWLNHAVTESLNGYAFSEAGEILRSFTWNDFADWYLEISKFEKNKEKEQVLIYVLENLLKLWHPFMPFVTEKIWSEMGKKDLLMIAAWPQEKEYFNLENSINFDEIIDIIKVVRNVRAENKIEPAQKIKAVIYAGKKKKLIDNQVHLIKNLRTGISELEIKEKGEKISGAIYAVVGGIEIYLIGAVDSEKEKARLEKEIANLEKIIKAVESRLANKEFTDKAPAEIVKKEKGKLKGWQAELKSLKSSLRI